MRESKPKKRTEKRKKRRAPESNENNCEKKAQVKSDLHIQLGPQHVQVGYVGGEKPPVTVFGG